MQFESRSKERFAVLSDTIRRSRSLQHLTCGMHRERSFHEVYQSPRVPRKAVITPSLHHLEARTSTDHQCNQSEEFGETRCEEFEEIRSGNIDFRIQGLLHSTVQEEDDVGRETVKKLIHQFATHPTRESLMADLNKTQQFNPFISESKELTSSMVNTEYFELCETSSTIQCLD